MTASFSPVQGGLVTSLARPGGNLTGLTIVFDFDIDGKRLQFLKEAVPTISRVGVLYRDPPSPPWSGQPFSALFKELVAAAQSLQVLLIPVLVQTPDQLSAVSAAIARERLDALYVDQNPINGQLRREIGELAAKTPAMARRGESAGRGGRIARLWAKYGRSVPARRRLRRQDPERREARRSANRAADKVRVHHQSQGGEADWADNPAGGAGAGG